MFLMRINLDIIACIYEIQSAFQVSLFEILSCHQANILLLLLLFHALVQVINSFIENADAIC